LINIAESNPVEVIKNLTDGLGADIVVECSGSPKAIESMPDLLKKMGKICVVGLTGGKMVNLNWDKFAFRVATVVFNLSTFYTSWDKAISLIHSGRIQAEKLVTHKEPLENWQKVFEDIENLKALKAILIP
jgi:L-iditol 2-dehydrogenase